MSAHSVPRHVVLFGLATAACGARNPKPRSPPASEGGSGHGDTSGASAAGEASEANEEAETAASPEPPERPFASSSLRAMRAIDDAVEPPGPVEACVSAARSRRNTPHAEIVVEIGIDQEGSLIGLKTPKNAPKDPEFSSACAGAARRPLPRSKSGVITMKKRFTEQAQRRPVKHGLRRARTAERAGTATEPTSSATTGVDQPREGTLP